MRRILYAAVMIAALLIPSSAFAGETRVMQTPEGVQLGDLTGWLILPGYDAYERVNIYMQRPAAYYPDEWPFDWAPPDGAWWWSGPESRQRRFTRDNWGGSYADAFGYFYANFYLPRDEVWYPCSFPYKWKCNYMVDPFEPIIWHSPASQPFEGGLYWPWLDWDEAADPGDTISPLEVMFIGDNYGFTWIAQTYVLGYYWKWTDIP